MFLSDELLTGSIALGTDQQSVLIGEVYPDDEALVFLPTPCGRRSDETNLRPTITLVLSTTCSSRNPRGVRHISLLEVGV